MARFHVVIDDWFTTIWNAVTDDDAVDPEKQADIFSLSQFQVFFKEDDQINFDDEWLTLDELQKQNEEQTQQI